MTVSPTATDTAAQAAAAERCQRDGPAEGQHAKAGRCPHDRRQHCREVKGASYGRKLLRCIIIHVLY